MPHTHIRRLCVLSADPHLLTTIEGEAARADLQYHRAADCRGCASPCASIVAVDVDRADYLSVVQTIPRTPNTVVMGILPSTMPFHQPKQHGVEVIVYRELVNQFLSSALRICLFLLEAAEARRNHIDTAVQRVA
jgi:hypothetical protein